MEIYLSLNIVKDMSRGYIQEPIIGNEFLLIVNIHTKICAISQYAVYTIKMSEKIESFPKIVITDSQKVIPSFFRLFSNTFWTFFRKTPMV